MSVTEISGYVVPKENHPSDDGVHSVIKTATPSVKSNNDGKKTDDSTSEPKELVESAETCTLTPSDDPREHGEKATVDPKEYPLETCGHLHEFANHEGARPNTFGGRPPSRSLAYDFTPLSNTENDLAGRAKFAVVDTKEPSLGPDKSDTLDPDKAPQRRTPPLVAWVLAKWNTVPMRQKSPPT